MAFAEKRFQEFQPETFTEKLISEWNAARPRIKDLQGLIDEDGQRVYQPEKVAKDIERVRTRQLFLRGL